MNTPSTPKKTGGLAGVVAGKTAIATVGHEGTGLHYRGYSIFDLAEQATFEEVAYLLLHGSLPTASQLSDFQNRLVAARPLPAALKDTLRSLPRQTPPMDVLRTDAPSWGAWSQRLLPNIKSRWQKGYWDAFPRY